MRDTVETAKRTHEWTPAREVAEAIASANAPLFPRGDFAEFSKYNIGLEKARMDAAGWMKAGPCRPPYHLVPPEYLKGAQEAGRLWAQHAARLASK